jgi:hypothetical protein
MDEPKPKLSDLLDYFADMSQTLAKGARINGLDVLAHIFDMAALEALSQLETARANEA